MDTQVPIRCGMGMPVLTQIPGGSAAWESTATMDDVVAVAQAADRLGFHHVMTSHHVAVPSAEVDHYAESHGSHFWDPVAAFAFLAANTSRVRFLPYCYVIGFTHPLELAKRFGTVDLISGGRMILGFGVGNFEPEFRTLGKSFADRGAIADDTLRALRATLGNTVSSYSGEFFEYESYVVSPNAVQERMPMWIAGHSRRALRRATELGDGWMPTPAPYGGPDDDAVRSMMAQFDVPEGFEVLLSPGGALDPLREEAAVREHLAAASAGPATLINVRFKHDSRDELIDQMAAFAAIAGFTTT